MKHSRQCFIAFSNTWRKFVKNTPLRSISIGNPAFFVTCLFSRSLVRGWCTSLTSYPTSTNLASPDPCITDTESRHASSSKNESRLRLARKTPMDCRLHLPPSVPLLGRAGPGRYCPRLRVPCCGVQAP